MSSIYRKGRDGYFYYQTYVYNNETKKNNKRIFHSLKTKDELVAKEKKKILDKKYDSQQRKNNETKIKKILKSTFIVFFIFTTIWITYKFLFIKNGRSKKLEISLPAVEAQKKVEKLKIVQNDTTAKPENISIDYTDNDEKPRKMTHAIPKYKIERIQENSGTFKQVKIYVSVKLETDDFLQHLICKELAQKYSKFQSIIICLYSNEEDGIELARSISHNNNLSIQKKHWLAMYTYNEVEGEYFDKSPNKYLGIK